MLLEPSGDGLDRAIGKQINRKTTFQITDQRTVAQSAFPGSGKGNDVAIIPSPKNRTGGFLHIRLKPFAPPVSPDAASPRKVPGGELVDGKLDEAALGFLRCLVLLLIAREYDGCATL